jgi:hypothetical protein
LARKAKKTIKRGVSDRAFKQEFAKIISGHLSLLPPEEQDRRIEAGGGRYLRAAVLLPPKGAKFLILWALS